MPYAHSQHIESHLGKTQPQVKIPTAFLFTQLHFNNHVNSDALFHGGHLVKRSRGCAVQNQRTTLKGKARRQMECLVFIQIPPYNTEL